MFFEINPEFKAFEKEILLAFLSFDNSGEKFIEGERNQIKVFKIGENQINIKSFKIPNKFNQLVYRYFRPSKAKRSFEFANLLLQKGIGTPRPVAFQENFGDFGLQKSFYASIHQEYDLTYRELVEVKDFPDKENILRQFTRFCFNMHQQGIEFKDHSPGNTLIKKIDEKKYEFFLVDLNRMKFHHSMDIALRMKNLSKLTPKKEMVGIMADEYAKMSNHQSDELFKILWKFTEEFQKKYHRKQNAKNKIKSFIKSS